MLVHISIGQHNYHSRRLKSVTRAPINCFPDEPRTLPRHTLLTLVVRDVIGSTSSNEFFVFLCGKHCFFIRPFVNVYLRSDGLHACVIGRQWVLVKTG